MDSCRLAKLVGEMRANPANIRFADLYAVCVEYFKAPRNGSGSHVAIFKMPWPGNPRANIQPGHNGKAKPYQVKQVIEAIDKLERLGGANE